MTVLQPMLWSFRWEYLTTKHIAMDKNDSLVNQLLK
jgi:hypothetical protein